MWIGVSGAVVVYRPLIDQLSSVIIPGPVDLIMFDRRDYGGGAFVRAGGQWSKGKCAPGFSPLGPWLVTKDEVGDVQNLSMWLDVNGERKQTGTTATMIFDVATLVSHRAVSGSNPSRVVRTAATARLAIVTIPSPR